jgi:hypothetical protein
VERLAAELSDHLVDLKEETMRKDDAVKDDAVLEDEGIESRLGSPAGIARAAEASHRVGLLRRSPAAAVAVFALLPIPALVLLWVAAGLLWWFASELFVYVVESSGRADALGDALEAWARKHESGGVALLRAIITASVAVPAAGLAAAYCRLSKRTGRSLLWATVGCLLIVAASAALRHQVTPADRSGHGTIMVGLETGMVSGWQVAQAAVPAAVGLAFAWRTRRPRRPLAIA